MPTQPVRLTVGMASPQDVAAQKQEYSRSLDEQQRQGEAILSQQTHQQREHLRLQAEQQKVLAMGRWDQHLRAQELLAEREYQQQLAALREAARQRMATLEEQASQLIMEYNARKAQQEVNLRDYELQVRRWEAEAQHFHTTLGRTAREQSKLQFQLAMHEQQAARRGQDLLPELPVDQWVPGAGPGLFGAERPSSSPYPLAPLSQQLDATWHHGATSSVGY